nr:hypothetical protein CFP56_54443 [Quercus suber]
MRMTTWYRRKSSISLSKFACVTARLSNCGIPQDAGRIISWASNPFQLGSHDETHKEAFASFGSSDSGDECTSDPWIPTDRLHQTSRASRIGIGQHWTAVHGVLVSDDIVHYDQCALPAHRNDLVEVSFPMFDLAMDIDQAEFLPVSVENIHPDNWQNLGSLAVDDLDTIGDVDTHDFDVRGRGGEPDTACSSHGADFEDVGGVEHHALDLKEPAIELGNVEIRQSFFDGQSVGVIDRIEVDLIRCGREQMTCHGVVVDLLRQKVFSDTSVRGLLMFKERCRSGIWSVQHGEVFVPLTVMRRMRPSHWRFHHRSSSLSHPNASHAPRKQEALGGELTEAEQKHNRSDNGKCKQLIRDRSDGGWRVAGGPQRDGWNDGYEHGSTHADTKWHALVMHRIEPHAPGASIRNGVGQGFQGILCYSSTNLGSLIPIDERHRRSARWHHISCPELPDGNASCYYEASRYRAYMQFRNVLPTRLPSYAPASGLSLS